jgi:hypothetical protein
MSDLNAEFQRHEDERYMAGVGPRELTEFPGDDYDGKVLIGSPLSSAVTRAEAMKIGVDYYLTPAVGRGQAFLVDCGALFRRHLENMTLDLGSPMRWAWDDPRWEGLGDA